MSATAPHATGQGLVTGFLDSTRARPDAPALATAERTWSYGELEDTARRWAGAILETLDRPAERVGVFGYRSEASYAGVLAALLSGGAFVPLTPTMPAARTRDMIRSARVDALIVDRTCLPQLSQALEGEAPPILLPDAAASEAQVDATVRDAADLRAARPLREVPSPPADATAYLLFTSGSTGTPKGVPISHANVRHFLEVNERRYRLTRDDRLSQTFEQTFDLSVFDLFMAWGNGACVCVPGSTDLLSPFRYIERHGITLWFSVPSLATLLLRKSLLGPGSLPSLRWSLFCGEALSRETAEAWRAAAPHATLENLYGPTECTIACTSYRWDPERSPGECVNGLVPIGRPFDGVHTIVVDEELAPAGTGEPGELCVAGPQTFAGYWHDPGTTSSRFFNGTGPKGEELRYYRTGDRVSRVATGDHVFHGRVDNQVQVLGHRVELGEVEATLLDMPGVSEAAAIPVGLTAGSAEGIVAFVAGAGLDGGALATLARTHLPPYMAPRAVRVLKELPRNTNGKIDRSALRKLLNE